MPNARTANEYEEEIERPIEIIEVHQQLIEQYKLNERKHEIVDQMRWHAPKTLKEVH